MFPFLATTQAGCRRSFPRPLLHKPATLAVAAVVVLAAQAVHSQRVDADQASRPNIVLIMADDIGYECFGAYGSRQYRTPELDRMAAEGMRFTHCYSQPLCTPSRVKLMTGLSNARNYAAFSILKRGERTIGHRLQDAGYRTMVAGKWQLYGAEHYGPAFRARGALPADAGFDEWCLWQVKQLGQRYQGPLLTINGETKQFPDDKFGPAVVNDHVLKFMERNRSRPFFVYYPMILVHSPFVKTPDSEPRPRKNRQRNFEDMVAYMDKMVGRVLQQAKRLGIDEQTVVLFCGDNGTHKSITSKLNGKSVVGGKGTMRDAGTRVALIVRWPQTVAPGAVCEDLVDFSDLLPTCLDAVGSEPPAGLDGRTFLPQLRGEAGDPREWIYCFYCPRPERTKPQRFVRDRRWKLYGDGKFYDVANDVLERRELADSKLTPAALQAKRALQKALEKMPAEGQSLWRPNAPR